MSVDYLLLRRDGGLWAAAGESVRDVRSANGGVLLQLTGGGVLDADEVAGVARDLAVHACGAVLRACWHEPARGLAIYAGVPCVVIDPATPPHALSLRTGAVAGRALANEEEA